MSGSAAQQAKGSKMKETADRRVPVTEIKVGDVISAGLVTAVRQTANTVFCKIETKEREERFWIRWSDGQGGEILQTAHVFGDPTLVKMIVEGNRRHAFEQGGE